LWTQIERQLSQPGFVPGWSLGIQNLDSILGFIDPGRQIVIASRPGMGKTSTALKIAHNLAVVKHEPVLIFSYEMGEVELMRRLAALDAGINSRKLKNPGQLSEAEIRRVQVSLGRITNSPLYFGPTGDINTVRAVARRQSAQAAVKWGKPLAAVVIDYLQLMAVSRSSRAGNRDQEIGEITRALKNTARELHCMVFTLSQLNRLVEQTQSRLPGLAHLRESGNIEADADIVIFPFPPAAYMNPTEQQRELAHYEAGWEPYKQIVAKWRDGAIGIAECMWSRSTGEIRSLVRG
jgi:replicative DNA helicase